MNRSLPGAGRSSFDLIDPEILFGELHLTNETVFLDLGCGKGDYTLEAAKRGAGVVYGMDLWDEGIATLRKRVLEGGLKNLLTLISDLSKPIPLANQCVDVCLMATVLHDLVLTQAAGNALNQARRVLTEKGILAVVEFKKVDGPPGPPVSIRLAPEEVERLATSYGFLKKKTVEIGSYNYLMLFSL